MRSLTEECSVISSPVRIQENSRDACDQHPAQTQCQIESVIANPCIRDIVPYGNGRLGSRGILIPVVLFDIVRDVEAIYDRRDIYCAFILGIQFCGGSPAVTFSETLYS